MSRGYRREVDGLRAFAVVPVVLFHAQLGFPGGFVGVDVFFVISGYLITSLILKEGEVFSLAYFWERRVRRIVPAATVTVLACLILGWFLLLPADFLHLGRSMVAQSLLVSNLFFWRDLNYFATNEVRPLLHTWSLAVEEQFYVCLPLLFYVLRKARRAVPWSLATLALISFAASVRGVLMHPSATFYLLPTRAWELLTGS
ncbi:MAG: acyltransferase, partial [Polyangiaceae bacterium]